MVQKPLRHTGTAIVQHPYGESDEEKNTGAGEARAYTGYVGPFPAVNVQ